MRPFYLSISLVLAACSGVAANETETTSSEEVPAGSPLSKGVSECAKIFDGLKGAGHTVENAQRLEVVCRDAQVDLTALDCSDFLKAASRAGFKAAANIGVWSNAGTAQYLDAANEANEARAACGV